MTTTKQRNANQRNAQLSTGPVTEEGKVIVCQNAVKHGIFTKDILILSGDGKEDAKEYGELLTNLIQDLKPNGQMQHLLVEKIAVDFWRLKRVLRYETGSIRQHLDSAIDDHYDRMGGIFATKTVETHSELDKKIKEQLGFIEWNKAYIKCLKKGIVDFENSTWSSEEIESDTETDLFNVAEVLKYTIFSEEERNNFEEGKINLEGLKAALKKAGYGNSEIAEQLIKFLLKENEERQQKVGELEKNKVKNCLAEEVAIKRQSLPVEDDAEKVMKYEKAIQKSILQNLALLKRLQMAA